MTMPQPPRRSDLHRLWVLGRCLGGAVVWGVIELLALQRQRYQQRRWDRSL
jgi:hypothetical protein